MNMRKEVCVHRTKLIVLSESLFNSQNKYLLKLESNYRQRKKNDAIKLNINKLISM